ncbi:MAG: SDR family oxidoreductase [Bacteroidota bacterium]
MKIAVTAASGQLGSAIVEALKELVGPESVIALARTPAKAEHLGVEVRRGDYNDKSSFLESLKGVDAVLLLSANGAPGPRVQQHRNVIEAAKESGVKKIVYTSILGTSAGSNFSPIVASNRQTEQDIQASSLNWVIGRNGIYLEPDLEYIDTYVKEGGIINSAGEGKCAYTSRPELGYGYARLLTDDSANGQHFNMTGEPITQAELAKYLNEAFGVNLSYKAVEPAAYTKERQETLGEFMGQVIGGIYHSMHDGAFDVSSDFEKAAGRPHKSVKEMIAYYQQQG